VNERGNDLSITCQLTSLIDLWLYLEKDSFLESYYHLVMGRPIDLGLLQKDGGGIRRGC